MHPPKSIDWTSRCLFFQIKCVNIFATLTMGSQSNMRKDKESIEMTLNSPKEKKTLT
jgi:hypothetical protein